MQATFQDFLFPASCLHCDLTLTGSATFLCHECAALLPWLDPTSRCRRCFLTHCDCARLLPPFYRYLAVFSYAGPAHILINQFRFQQMLQLTDLLASCLLLQIERAGIERPHLLVPVPLPPWDKLFSGISPSLLLATALSKKMQLPCKNILRHIFIERSLAHRGDLYKENPYRVRRGSSIVDQHILLVDTVKITGKRLTECAEALKAHCTSRISACTVALLDEE